MQSENIIATVLPVSPAQQMSPDSKTAAKSLSADKVKKPKKKRILMIEDDRDMSALMKKALMSRFYCEIDVAQDPFEALNRVVDRFYDLIILDWQLPGLNGTDTLAEAEKGLRFEPSIPIQWDTAKAPVVIFSSQKKSECLPRRTKHFNYIGFISKMQSLPEILKSFSTYIEAPAEQNTHRTTEKAASGA